MAKECKRVGNRKGRRKKSIVSVNLRYDSRNHPQPVDMSSLLILNIQLVITQKDTGFSILNTTFIEPLTSTIDNAY